MTTTYHETLNKVLSLLKSKPRTALEIAKLTKCSKPTAYARLQALKKAGVRLARTKVRQGSTGPAATAYSVA